MRKFNELYDDIVDLKNAVDIVCTCKNRVDTVENEQSQAIIFLHFDIPRFQNQSIVC